MQKRLLFPRLWAAALMSLCMLCGTVGAMASPVGAIPYEEGFEDSTAVADWQYANVPPNIFHPDQTVQTHWGVGTADSRFGASSLYVMQADGSMGYTAGGYAVAAYRTFNIPAGQYTLSFDCKVMGTAKDGLYAAWVPASTAVTGAQTGSSLPSYAVANPVANVQGLRGLSSFQHITTSLVVTQEHAAEGYNLVFLWLVNGTTVPTAFSACIDNLLITRTATATDCFATPTSLTYENTNGTAHLGWTGNADSYEVQVIRSNSKTPFLVQTTADNFINISFADMPEGIYSFWVRALCGTDCSQWAMVTDKMVYDPSLHCLDYLNFHAPGVECRYGTWDSGYGSSVSISSNNVGVIDNGYAAESSRHTIHYREGETDSRTDNLLPTKPAGALASVRLGNWNTGSEWESITYTLTVGDDIGVLLLKYAVVLQDPDHSAIEQPRFTLEILNANGQLIDATCGSADFKASANLGAGWHTAGSGYDLVRWKEWTTVGMNVRELRGQVIKIRLTTYDCSQSGHYGYAYFTLDCSSGEMQGVTCGEKPRTLSVDDGFNYHWYKPNNPNEPFYEGQNPSARELYIAASDSNLYACDMISRTNAACYYTLQASAMARFPKARATFTHAPKECLNYMAIQDHSGIFGYFTNPDTGEQTEVTMSARCETYRWTLLGSDGSDSLLFCTNSRPDPLLFPNEGGDYKVRLQVTMSGESCFDDQVFDVHVPAIGATEAVTTEYICEGESTTFHGQTYDHSGVYQVVLTNYAGCDSILTLNLEELKTVTLQDSVIVCSDKPYSWRGQNITQSGWYYGTVPYKTRKTECDSLHLEHYVTVLEALQASLDHIPAEICGDAQTLPISFHVNAGIAGSYSLLFDATGHKGGFEDIQDHEISKQEADNLTIELPIAGKNGQYKRPDAYTATLSLIDVNACSNVEFPIAFDVLYPDTVLMQLWDDVITVKNPEYNGGYDFTAFQWYKDGNLLSGENSFRLYDPINKLDPNAEYTVLLTRVEDGKAIMTCPFRPKAVSSEEATLIILGVSGGAAQGAPLRIETSRAATVNVLNALGMLVSSTEVSAGTTLLPLPTTAGVYLLVATDSMGQTETNRIIVR